jgi:hypothetical protein
LLELVGDFALDDDALGRHADLAGLVGLGWLVIVEGFKVGIVCMDTLIE